MVGSQASIQPLQRCGTRGPVLQFGKHRGLEKLNRGQIDRLRLEFHGVAGIHVPR
jgi:hypothetical protein